MQWTGAEDLDYFNSQAFLLKTLTNYRAAFCMVCKDWYPCNFQYSGNLSVNKLKKENKTRTIVTSRSSEVEDHFGISCTLRQIHILIISLT